MEVEYKDLTISQVIRLSKKGLSKSEFIVEYLNLTTNLSKQEIIQLTLNDAIDIMLKYIYERFQNPEIARGITVIDLYDDNSENGAKMQDEIRIGGYLFNDKITVEQLRLAEKRAAITSSMDIFGLYAMASACAKGIDHGIEAIVNAKDDKATREAIVKLDIAMKKAHPIGVSFLRDPKNIIVGSNKYVSWVSDFFLFV